MKKKSIFLFIILIVIAIFFFISSNKEIILEQVLPEDIPVEVAEKILDLPSNASLGALCSGKIDCILFCKDNGDLCSNFCIDNPDNEVCSVFVPEDFDEMPSEYFLTKDF